MSYCLQTTCGNCSKMKTENPCQDSEKIREAISKIHMSNDGTHQGSGNIVMMCYNHDQDSIK